MKININILKPSTFSEQIYSHNPTNDLVESIRNNGILLPVWITEDNIIISGHRRVNACKILGIKEIDAETREYSDLLVIESNRYREKTWEEKLKEAEALERILKPKAKEKQKESGGAVPQKSDKPPIDILKETAKSIGTSHDTLFKAKTILKEKPELLKDIDEGKRSIHSAYTQILKEKQREERKSNKALPFPDGKYRTIVIDPPWPIEKITREVRPNQDNFDYPTMTLEEIQALNIKKIAFDEGCHIYLWTTHKFLPFCFEIFKTWGVNYECLLTWVKNVGFTPFSWMYSTEHILFGRIGNLELLSKGKRLDFNAKVEGHSRKPDIFYDLVKIVSPKPRIDLFGRRDIEGFNRYGNQ